MKLNKTWKKNLLVLAGLAAFAGAAAAGLVPPEAMALGAIPLAGLGVSSAAGTTIRIATGAPATYDSAGYTTLFASSPGWGKLIGEIVNYGEFGREFNLITHNPVNSRGTQKYKGSFNEGQLQLQIGLDTDDAGQILAKAASLSDNDYSFQITTPNGDKYFFRAKVMSWKVGVAGVDNIITATATLEITTNAAGVGIVESLAP